MFSERVTPATNSRSTQHCWPLSPCRSKAILSPPPHPCWNSVTPIGRRQHPVGQQLRWTVLFPPSFCGLCGSRPNTQNRCFSASGCTAHPPPLGAAPSGAVPGQRLGGVPPAVRRPLQPHVHRLRRHRPPVRRSHRLGSLRWVPSTAGHCTAGQLEGWLEQVVKKRWLVVGAPEHLAWGGSAPIVELSGIKFSGNLRWVKFLHILWPIGQGEMAQK